MRILILEDDPWQSNAIKSALIALFSKAEFQALETEHEFYRVLEQINGKCPWNLTISDVMMPWAFPDDVDAPQPPTDVLTGTFRRAGTRCWTKFRSTAGCENTPWIYFTVLGPRSSGFHDHRDSHTYYAQKESTIQPLTDIVCQALQESDIMMKIIKAGAAAPLRECTMSPQ